MIGCGAVRRGHVAGSRVTGPGLAEGTRVSVRTHREGRGSRQGVLYLSLATLPIHPSTGFNQDVWEFWNFGYHWYTGAGQFLG